MGRRSGPRLLSIPARHPYVDAVRPDGVRPVWPDRPPWDADPVFSPPVVTELAGLADVVHLHFGFDHLDADAAQRWVDALAAAGLPLVLTVHDLRNPHHPTRDRHDAVLGVLVPAAAAVITLTPGGRGRDRAPLRPAGRGAAAPDPAAGRRASAPMCPATPAW